MTEMTTANNPNVDWDYLHACAIAGSMTGAFLGVLWTNIEARPYDGLFVVIAQGILWALLGAAFGTAMTPFLAFFLPLWPYLLLFVAIAIAVPLIMRLVMWLTSSSPKRSTNGE